METSEQINAFQEFLEQNHKAKILDNISKGQKNLNIDFNELTRFSPNLAEDLLDNPEEVLKASEIAVERFDLDKEVKGFILRFYNLPQSQEKEIRNIRSAHLNKFIQIRGIVRQKSDVRPQVTSAKFECPGCGNVIPVLQLEAKFKEPTGCGCGRKGKFRLLSKELVDAQKIILEESTDDIEGSMQPKRLSIFLKNDLVSPLSEQKTNPGSKLLITGILNEIPIPSKDGGKLTRFDIMLEANHVEGIESEYEELIITPEEEIQIKELSKDPKIFEKIVNSLAPSIHGYEKLKLGLALQQYGGVKYDNNDGTRLRGDIHILLIGDPSAGKSFLLERISKISPKSRHITGKSSSSAGITASVIKDDFTGGWALEAGALVLANKGFAAVDELDKMDEEDMSAFHEIMEQQTVTVSKANINAILKAEVTILAAANPKFERFDAYKPLAAQFNLTSTLLSRFDLIFPLQDLPDKQKDKDLANFILLRRQKPESIIKSEDIKTDLLRKYIAYAKKNIKPKLSDEAVHEIQNYYTKMRDSSGDVENKSIPITTRQLEGLSRLSEASAKVRLSEIVTREDAKRAISIVHHCLSVMGLDPETGKIDIDRITSNITASERNHISILKSIINELENKIGKTIPILDIADVAKSKGIDETKLNDLIEKLKRAGELFEPRRGLIQKV